MLKKKSLRRALVLAVMAALLINVCPVFAEEETPGEPAADTQEVVKAEQIIQVKTDREITIGNTAKIGAVLKEGDGALSYASADKKVATVTSKGIVKARAVGKTTITVTAAETEKYAAQVCEVTITVIPKVIPVKSLVCYRRGQFTVKWTPTKKADGYQVEYAKADKKFKVSKTKKIKKAGTGKTIVKKLKKLRYYVRIRVYKIVNGETYYSKWSKVKSVRVR